MSKSIRFRQWIVDAVNSHEISLIELTAGGAHRRVTISLDDAELECLASVLASEYNSRIKTLKEIATAFTVHP